MLSPLYMWIHSCGNMLSEIHIQKVHLVPQVTVWDRVSCTALELVFCGVHE